jgi:hypothetical protein
MAKPSNYDDFMKSLEDQKPPMHWPDAFKVLWYDAKGDWNASHDIAQEMHGEIGSWLHAYLHRKEEDEFNARYWYTKAHRPFPKITLNEEQGEIIRYLL